MAQSILLWGLVAGLLHFVIVGILYQNPLVAQVYNRYKYVPALKQWPNLKEYLLKMFLGTQVEIYILTAAYFYLRTLFPTPNGLSTALILATIFAAIRVYPRFWTMWIQTTYPLSLLVIEAVNGTIGTFVILLILWFVAG